MVDVSDVARGHLLAASKGVIGERYILGGENLTLAEVFGRLEKLSGLPAPRIKLPYAVAWTYAMVAEAAARVITHKPPRASLTEVRMSRKRMFFDSTKARDVLGYVPGSVDAALSGAIGFFRETGIARP